MGKIKSSVKLISKIELIICKIIDEKLEILLWVTEHEYKFGSFNIVTNATIWQ